MVFGHILALTLSVVDFFTEGLFSKVSKNKMKFVSFAAGISIAYIFLILLLKYIVEEKNTADWYL